MQACCDGTGICSLSVDVPCSNLGELWHRIGMWDVHRMVRAVVDCRWSCGGCGRWLRLWRGLCMGESRGRTRWDNILKLWWAACCQDGENNESHVVGCVMVVEEVPWIMCRVGMIEVYDSGG